MSRPRESPPSEWAGFDGVELVPGSDDVYVRVGGSAGSDVLIWHWHTPADGDARWSLASCGAHTVVSVDPLHLEPSLACFDGCPSHGWIRGGKWVPA